MRRLGSAVDADPGGYGCGSRWDILFRYREGSETWILIILLARNRRTILLGQKFVALYLLLIPEWFGNFWSGDTVRWQKELDASLQKEAQTLHI